MADIISNRTSGFYVPAEEAKAFVTFTDENSTLTVPAEASGLGYDATFIADIFQDRDYRDGRMYSMVGHVTLLESAVDDSEPGLYPAVIDVRFPSAANVVLSEIFRLKPPRAVAAVRLLNGDKPGTRYIS